MSVYVCVRVRVCACVCVCVCVRARVRARACLYLSALSHTRILARLLGQIIVLKLSENQLWSQHKHTKFSFFMIPTNTVFFSRLRRCARIIIVIIM